MGGRTLEHRKLLGESFIEKSKRLYPNELTYEKVEYYNARTAVILTCIFHGDFEAIPMSHLQRGKCCTECARISYKLKKGMKRNDFLNFVSEVHNNKYVYLNLPPVINNQDKMSIVCPEHGEFTQKAVAHKNGKGCKTCGYMRVGGVGSYNETNIGRLSDIPYVNFYIFHLTNDIEDFIKVGITSMTVKRRASSIRHYTVEIINENTMKLDEAYELEQFILSESDNYKPSNKFDGHTECFKTHNNELFIKTGGIT